MRSMYIEFEIDDFLHESFRAELEILKTKYDLVDEKKAIINRIATTANRYSHHNGELLLDDLLVLADYESAFVDFYLWTKANIKNHSIDQAKLLYHNIEYDGYVVVDDDYLLCYQHADLDAYYEEKLDELLDDVDFVSECFEADDLARMWVDEESKASVARRLMDNERELQELLDMDLTEACELDGGEKLMYSMLY